MPLLTLPVASYMAEDTNPLCNVLGYKRKFVGLLGDWILSCGLKDKLADLGREWER